MCAGGCALEHEGVQVSDPHLYEWMALRRIHNGGMATSAGVYFDEGRPAPEYLARIFDYIIRTGLTEVDDGDPVWALRRMSLTDAGRLRYTELREKRGQIAQVPPPEHGTQTQEGTP